MNTNPAIRTAIQLLDGPVNAARRLGIDRYQTVQQWISSGSVPPKYCPAIETALEGKVTRRDLRPDDWYMIWPELVMEGI